MFRLRMFFVAVLSIASSGCGAIPQECSHPSFDAHDALIGAVQRALVAHVGLQDRLYAERFLAEQSKDCCSVSKFTPGILGSIFKFESARVKYIAAVNLEISDDSRNLSKYAEVRFNSCGRVIRYKGMAT